MPSCKEVAELISQSLDTRLPALQRVAVRLHFLACRVCALYRRQLVILREVVREAVRRLDDTPEIALPEQARRKIKQAVAERKCQ